VQAGMYGVLVVRPQNGDPNQVWTGGEAYEKELIITSSEIDTNWHTDAVLDHPYDTINPVPVMIPDDYIPQYFLVSGLSDTQLSNPANYYWAAEDAKVYLRQSNAGYYGTRYIYPSSVSARTLSSDGRPLPAEYVNDTLEVYPGERYGTMIQLGSDPFYTIDVEYFDLNTNEVKSTQTYTIRTSMAGLDENSIFSSTIYPVPSSTGVFYSSEEFQSEYEIYSITGNKILEGKNMRIDLSDQPKGMYIFQYEGWTKKLLIN
ncbi:MAG: T9SS type A sorting domain-containing protein, partial [Crocinitomicaceae bacterium]|nr:T9SS type A sorting domain-containing protein [Crocinitomicaceae bacterium]